MEDDQTKLALVSHLESSLSLMARPNVRYLNPTLNPKVWEELFTLKIQVKQDIINAIINIEIQKNLISIS